MKNNNNWVLYLIIAILVMVVLRTCDQEPETIEVPVEVLVEVPVVIKEFDTVYEPVEVYKTKKVIDTVYYTKYINLTEKQKDSAFKDAITIREYKETVEDDTIKIDISMQVQGRLKAYNVGYETKPRTVVVDTTLTIALPKYKPQIGLGLEVGIPTQVSTPFVLKANGVLDTKKQIYNLSYDTEKRVWAGVTFKF